MTRSIAVSCAVVVLDGILLPGVSGLLPEPGLAGATTTTWLAGSAVAAWAVPATSGEIVAITAPAITTLSSVLLRRMRPRVVSRQYLVNFTKFHLPACDQAVIRRRPTRMLGAGAVSLLIFAIMA
jgi:hypothetical protein